MTHGELIKEGIKWLKAQRGNSYSCPIITTELSSGAWEIPDIIGFSQSHSVLIECKTSLSDFKADFKKRHRNNYSPKLGTYRFYLCTSNLIPVALIPEKWGLLYYDKTVDIVLRPKPYGYDETRPEEYYVLYSLLRRNKRQYFNKGE